MNNMTPNNTYVQSTHQLTSEQEKCTLSSICLSVQDKVGWWLHIVAQNRQDLVQHHLNPSINPYQIRLETKM